MANPLRKSITEFLAVAVLTASVVGVNYQVPVTPLAPLVIGGVAVILLTLTLGKSSGYLNPAAVLYFAVSKKLSWRSALALMGSQLLGGVAGAFLGGALHGTYSLQVNQGIIGRGQLVSEVLVTTVSVWLIGHFTRQKQSAQLPTLLGIWLFAGALFTGSNAMGNPAVTLGRVFSFAAPIGVEQALYLLLAQAAGVLLAVVALRWLTPAETVKKPKKR